MPQYRVGQTATNPKTGQKVRWDGQNWVSAGATGAPAGGMGKQSQTVEKFFNELSDKAADAQEARRIYDNASKVVKKFDPGPYRGRLLEIATPEEGGGFFDSLGAAVVGGPLRMIGAITPQETDAYQLLRGYQSDQVLQKQLLQKGPQTDVDAARLQLTEISPSKSLAANRAVIEQGQRKAERSQARTIWLKRFAQKYGLNGRTPEGYTADELWAQKADYITQRLLHNAPAQYRGGGAAPTGNGTIKIISRRKVQ